MRKMMRMLIVLLVIILTVCGCGKAKEPVPTIDPNLEVLDYTLVAKDAAALQELDIYANLQTLDLRGSDCYDAIESYIASHPQVKVTYDVEIAGTRYASDVEHLTLEDGTYDPDDLADVLKHLPMLSVLELPKTSLNAQQQLRIADGYPNLQITYTLVLFDDEVSADLTELDLSGLSPEQLDENLLQKLQLLPNLTKIRLMDDQGTSSFAVADVKRLMDTVPGVAIDYTFQLYGQTISTADERLEFKELKILNEGIPEIRAALDILPNCTYLLVDNCGVDDEVMAQLRDDYPNVKVVWRVFWAYFNALTDVEMVRCPSRVNGTNIQVLKYCTEVKYLDLGHNSGLTSIDFARYMPELRVCILHGSNVSDITPLANCTKLEWLELVRCKRVTDISVLANCTNLKGLNTSMAYGITDLSPLYGLKNMERLYLGSTSITQEMYEEACEALPNCWVTNTCAYSGDVTGNYAIGWRLDAPNQKAEWYKWISEVFQYKINYYNGMNAWVKKR